MIDPYRRNLLAISAALLLFYLGEGQVKDTINLFGTFKLDKPEYLIYGAWAFFIYALWQFVVHQKDKLRSFRYSWTDGLVRDQEFHFLAIRWITRQFPDLDQDITERLIRGSHSSVVHGVFLVGYIPFWRSLELVRSDNAPKLRAYGTLQDSARLEWLIVRHQYPVFVREPIFSDHMLPHLFALAAFSIAVVKSV